MQLRFLETYQLPRVSHVITGSLPKKNTTWFRCGFIFHKIWAKTSKFSYNRCSIWRITRNIIAHINNLGITCLHTGWQDVPQHFNNAVIRARYYDMPPQYKDTTCLHKTMVGITCPTATTNCNTFQLKRGHICLNKLHFNTKLKNKTKPQ